MFERTALKLRERSGFESLDAGLFLYRKYFLKILSGFLPFYLPLVAGIAFIPQSYLWIAGFAVWWFIPLWSRLTLRPLAHIFFRSEGRPPWKGLSRGFWGDLLWRRFSPWRHLVLPVRMLERLNGRRLRKRISAIKRETAGYAFALNFVMFGSQLSLLSGIALFVVSFQSFIPHALRLDLSWSSPGVPRALVIAYALLVGLLEPASTAMGFSLYINRRVVLEGWDLEIAFRRWARRITSKTGTVLSLALVILIPLNIDADSLPGDPGPLESLQTVLSDPDFGGEKEVIAWRWKDTEKNPDSPALKLLDSDTGVFSRFLASGLRIAVIAGIAAAIIIVIWKNRGSLKGMIRNPGTGRYSTRRSRTLSAPDSDFNPKNALSLHQEGRFREAWSVLYRQVIRQISIIRHNAPGTEATEGEWLGFLQTVNNERSWNEYPADCFTSIILHWRNVAYAHRVPDEEVFMESLKAVTPPGEKGGK